MSVFVAEIGLHTHIGGLVGSANVYDFLPHIVFFFDVAFAIYLIDGVGFGKLFQYGSIVCVLPVFKVRTYGSVTNAEVGIYHPVDVEILVKSFS